MNIELPLVSLSREYFNYAQEKENIKHYRVEDIRNCKNNLSKFIKYIR